MHIWKIGLVLACWLLVAGCQPLYAQVNHNENFSFDKNCCEKQRQIAYDALNLEKLENEKIEIGIIEIDLNNDSLTDFLAQIYSPLHCGTAGCSFHIFLQNDHGEYKEVNGPSNAYWDIGVSQTFTNGMRDLIFKDKDGKNCLWNWQVESYEFKYCEENLKDREGEQVQDLSVIKLHYYKEGYQDLCNEILEKNRRNALKDIQVGSYPENVPESFFADIDNDGNNEKFKYDEVGNYVVLKEVVDGQAKYFSSPLAQTAFYSGGHIIKLNNKFFLMHTFFENISHRGSLEIQYFTKITEDKARIETPPEMRKNSFNTLRYKVDVICKYYPD